MKSLEIWKKNYLGKNILDFYSEIDEFNFSCQLYIVKGRDGRLSRDFAGSRSRSRESPGLRSGPGLKATGQSGPGQKSAG